MFQNNRMWRNLGRSLVLTVLAIVLIFSTSITKEVSAQQSFTDVTKENVHYDNIIEAAKLKFMTGYEDDTFKPYDKMPRANVVKALGKYVVAVTGMDMEDIDVTGVKPFKDVPSTYIDSELYQYSLIVKQAGIFSGSNNELMPTDLITRQQMAKVLVHAFQLQDVAGVQSIVIDNDLAYPDFREYIDILSKNNVTTVKEFMPVDSMTRQQFASFLIAAHNVQKDAIEEPGDGKDSEDKQDPKEDPTEDPKENPEEDPTEDPKEEEDPPAPVNPVAVEDLLPVTKFIPFTEDLPATVNVTYSDGSVKEHDVIWDIAGIDFTRVGEHEVQGEVDGTELTTTLLLKLQKIIVGPLLPLPPNVILLPPNTSEPEVQDAQSLINSLEQAVRDADNAMDAVIKWGFADEAVKEVNRKFPEYDTSNWETILSEQWEVIEKRLADTNKAKNAAAIAIDRLSYNLERVKKESDVQPIIDDAAAKLAAYEKLDKKANVSKMTSDLNKYKKIADDLKIALAAIDDRNMDLIIRNKGGLSPNYKFIFPQDQRVEPLWTIPKGKKHVDYEKGLLKRNHTFGGPANIEFVAHVWIGDVAVSKTYDVEVSVITLPSLQDVRVSFPKMAILIDD